MLILLPSLSPIFTPHTYLSLAISPLNCDYFSLSLCVYVFLYKVICFDHIGIRWSAFGKTVWFRNIFVWNNLWNLKHLETNQNRNVFVIFTLGSQTLAHYSFNRLNVFVFFFSLCIFRQNKKNEQLSFCSFFIWFEFVWSKAKVQLKRKTNNKMPIHLNEQFKLKSHN